MHVNIQTHAQKVLKKYFQTHNSTVIKSQTVPLTDKTQHFAQLTLIQYVHVLICLLGI